jgi:hypothetical protein
VLLWDTRRVDADDLAIIGAFVSRVRSKSVDFAMRPSIIKELATRTSIHQRGIHSWINNPTLVIGETDKRLTVRLIIGTDLAAQFFGGASHMMINT